MVHAELLSYIREQLKNGYDESVLRHILVKEGWSNEMVEEGFRKAEMELAEELFPKQVASQDAEDKYGKKQERLEVQNPNHLLQVGNEHHELTKVSTWD